jgi:hypothetical protein
MNSKNMFWLVVIKQTASGRFSVSAVVAIVICTVAEERNISLVGGLTRLRRDTRWGCIQSIDMCAGSEGWWWCLIGAIGERVKGSTLSRRAEQSKAKAGTPDDALTNDKGGLRREE